MQDTPSPPVTPPPPHTHPSTKKNRKQERKKEKKRKRQNETVSHLYYRLTLVRCQSINVLFYVCSYRGEKKTKIRCFTEYSVITTVNVSRCIVYLNVGERFHRIESLNLDDPFSLKILYLDVGKMIHRIQRLNHGDCLSLYIYCILTLVRCHTEDNALTLEAVYNNVYKDSLGDPFSLYIPYLNAGERFHRRQYLNLGGCL